MEKDNDKLKQLIAEEVRTQLGSTLFTARKVTDTPTDDYQAVPRKYVNLHGTARPNSSVIGQHFFDTSLGAHGKIIIWNGTGWVDPSGAYA